MNFDSVLKWIPLPLGPRNVVSQDYTAWNLGQALTCKQVDDRRKATSNHHVTTKTNKFIANDHFFCRIEEP